MDTREQIRSFIEDTFFVRDFGDDDSFVDAGIIDSLGMLQLVSFLEEQFGIQIADSDMIPENLGTLARVAGYVENKRRLTA